MNRNRKKAVLVFVPVSVAVVIVALLIVFGRPYFLTRMLTIHVLVQRAPGIVRDTPVFKDGFEIGSVKSMHMIEETNEIVVSIEIQPEALVSHVDECIVVEPKGPNRGFLEFVRGRIGGAADLERLRDGETIHGQLQKPNN